MKFFIIFLIFICNYGYAAKYHISNKVNDFFSEIIIKNTDLTRTEILFQPSLEENKKPLSSQKYSTEEGILDDLLEPFKKISKNSPENYSLGTAIFYEAAGSLIFYAAWLAPIIIFKDKLQGIIFLGLDNILILFGTIFIPPAGIYSGGELYQKKYNTNLEGDYWETVTYFSAGILGAFIPIIFVSAILYEANSKVLELTIGSLTLITAVSIPFISGITGYESSKHKKSKSDLTIENKLPQFCLLPMQNGVGLALTGRY